MRRIIGAIGAAVLALTLTACDVTPGGHCDQAGSQHTNDDGTVYTCKVNTQTGKNYWYH